MGNRTKKLKKPKKNKKCSRKKKGGVLRNISKIGSRKLRKTYYVLWVRHCVSCANKRHVNEKTLATLCTMKDPNYPNKEINFLKQPYVLGEQIYDFIQKKPKCTEKNKKLTNINLFCTLLPRTMQTQQFISLGFNNTYQNSKNKKTETYIPDKVKYIKRLNWCSEVINPGEFFEEMIKQQQESIKTVINTFVDKIKNNQGVSQEAKPLLIDHQNNVSVENSTSYATSLNDLMYHVDEDKNNMVAKIIDNDNDLIENVESLSWNDITNLKNNYYEKWKQTYIFSNNTPLEENKLNVLVSHGQFIKLYVLSDPHRNNLENIDSYLIQYDVFDDGTIDTYVVYYDEHKNKLVKHRKIINNDIPLFEIEKGEYNDPKIDLYYHIKKQQGNDKTKNIFENCQVKNISDLKKEIKEASNNFTLSNNKQIDEKQKYFFPRIDENDIVDEYFTKEHTQSDSWENIPEKEPK